MAEEFNPFHRLLGLDPKIKAPHHFQLLGVNPRLNDEKQIKTAVESGVKRCLNELVKVPKGQHAELIQKLKKRIAVARKTLLVPELRLAYLTKLKQQIKAQQSARQSSKTGLVDQPQPIKRNLQTDSKIPLAVPLAVDPVVGATVLAANPISSPASGVAINRDGVPIDQVRIDKSKMRRRKKSNLGLVLGLLMIAFVAVGALIVFLFKDALFELAGVGSKIPAAPGIVETATKGEKPIPAIGGNGDKKNASASKPKSTLPSFDLDSLPEVDEMEVLSHPQTQAATARDEKKLAAVIEREKKHVGDDPPMAEKKPAETPPEELGPLVEFDEFQLSKIRRHLQRARRCMARHELIAASTAIDYANSVRAEVATAPNARFGPSQAPIAALVAETKEIQELIGGFWEQVIASSKSIPGSQELEASGQKIAFLESDDEKVVVRHAGSNVTYPFSFCPPSLAVALANQGAPADVPTWNRQLGAFYAVDQVVNGKDHKTSIDKLLKESEQAGHDCDGIRKFARFQFDAIGMPDKKIQMPNKKKFNELIGTFREENEYDAPSKISPGTALTMAELLLQIDSPNFEQHVVLLEELRLIAIQLGDASLTEDAIIELDHFAKIDQANLTCDSFLALANKNLSSQQRRKIAERAIPFLKSDLGSKAKLRSRLILARKLAGFAAAHNMIDIARRINQIKNMK